MKYLKLVFLAAGVWLLAATVRSVGWEGVWPRVTALGFWIVPLFSIYGLVYAANTLGWIHSFPRALPSGIPFGGFFAARLIGETFNSLIPWAASLGGEPFKAHFLKSRYGVPFAEGMASVLIVHTTFYVSLNAFVVVGLLAGTRGRELPSPLLWGILVFLGALGSAAALLVVGLHWGLFARVARAGKRFSWGAKLAEHEKKWEALDHEIRAFYAVDRRRFWLSTIWNFAAWTAGVLETWLAARLLGIPLTFGEAWLLEVLIQSVRVATFFIPASVGAQEGGIVYLFSQMGLPAGPALAVAILRRLREIVWMAAGLAVWGLLRQGKTGGAEEL